MKHFDVLISGGGMVGACLALALRPSGLRVALVDRQDPRQADHPSFDDRAIALAWGTRQLLDALGLWSRLAPRAQPIRQVHVSERGHFGFAHLRQRHFALPALGYVVTARAFGQVLEQALAESPRLHLLRPAQVTGLRAGPDQVQVDLSTDTGPQRLSAALLVAADGDGSLVRRRLGIRLDEKDYQQSAVIGSIAGDIPHQGQAFERFTPEGPLALLPLTPGRCAFVRTTANRRLDEVLAWSDQDFVRDLQQSFGYRLGRLHSPGPRQAYPLRLAMAREITRHRVVLIGNAAHRLHPVAGQGFNLGARDLAELAASLHAQARLGGDPGAPRVLEGYRRRREGDLRRTAGLTDALVRGFTLQFPPLPLARNLGLLLLDQLPPLKRRLGHILMGLDGRLPHLTAELTPGEGRHG